MRRTCRSSTAGSFSLPCAASVEQLVVRDAAPQEERQARREVQSLTRYDAPAATPVGIPLDAEQELRIDEQTFERHLDAGVECPSFRPE